MPQLYNNGFGVFAPFPDNTENLLNSPNTFGSGGFINFNVQPDGDTPKYYIYPVKFDSYHNGRLIASQLVNNSLVLLERNTQRGTPMVSLIKDSITQTVSGNSQVFSYDVKVGDTLEILLRAVHPFQQSTLLTIDGSNLNQNHLNSTPLYSEASFTPQNGFNGTFHSTDSNFVLFRFIPLGNNYVLGPKLVKYNFNFSEGYCIYPERQGFKLRIRLSMDPAIGDEIGQLIVSDTLALCLGDSVNVQSLGDSLNFRWEHPILTNTALAQQSEISFFPSTNSWLYIGDSLGNRTDSVYLYFDIPPLVPIQRNLNSFTFNPNALGTTLRPDYWLYNGVLPLYSPVAITEIPIQGSGTYGWQLEDPRFNCSRLSEVDTVIEDNIWGSLFEDIELVQGETYPDKIRVFVEVTSEKKIDSVYFLGFDPLASPMFTLRNQLVFFDLYEGNVKIAGSTNVFLGTTKIAFELGQILKPGKQYYFDFTLDPDDVYNANDLSDVTYPLVHNDIIVSGVQRSTANTIGPSNSCPQIGFKFNESIGTGEEVLFQLAIYPNPAVDRIKVSMPNNTSQEIFDIHDLKGKTLIHGLIKHGQTIDVSHLPKGIYYLILEQGLSQKVVKH